MQEIQQILQYWCRHALPPKCSTGQRVTTQNTQLFLGVDHVCLPFFFFCFSPLKILIYSDLEIKHFILILKFHPLPLNVKIASDRFKYCVSTHDKLSSALHASVLCFSPAHVWLRGGERPVRPLIYCLPIAQESSMLVGPTHKTSIMIVQHFRLILGPLFQSTVLIFYKGQNVIT